MIHNLVKLIVYLFLASTAQAHVVISNMEWVTTESGKYRIESLSAATIPGALKVVTDSFCKDERVCTGTEVNLSPEAAQESAILCADVALDGVSLVAVEIATGEVVAIAFNKLQLPTNPSERPYFQVFADEQCKQDSSRALIKFMADVNAKCNFFEKYGVDCILEIMFLGTVREHRGNKLGKLLCKTSIKLARKLNEGPVSKITVQDLGPKYSFIQPRPVTDKVPKVVQAIWSAKGSQAIGRSLGFKVYVTISFKDFIYKGKSYSERLNDDTAFCQLVAFDVDNDVILS